MVSSTGEGHGSRRHRRNGLALGGDLAYITGQGPPSTPPADTTSIPELVETLNGPASRSVVDDLRTLVEQERVRQAVTMICAETVEPERVSWLWPGRIAQGKIAILEGDPGLGKSTMLLDLAARLSRGDTMPDGTPIERPGASLILSAEDGIADTIVPRLMAAGADLARIHILEGIPCNDGSTRPLTLPTDFTALQTAIETSGAELVIIDPLAAFLSQNVDSHRDQDVRRVLHQLKQLAEETGAAVLICRHLTKAGGVGNPLYRGGGSIGIIGAARVAMMVARDPDDPDSGRVIVAVSKSNLEHIPLALCYTLTGDSTLGCARIEWQGTTRHTARDLVAMPTEGSGKGSALKEAMDFLREELADGPKLATEVKEAAEAAGVSTATLRRAKEALEIKAKREAGGIGESRPWNWHLPGTE